MLYVIGVITADTPIINNKLNILEPTIFPIAISLSPLIAAVKLVTSSGRLVPIATIVNPIIFSLIFNAVATNLAFSTTKSPPIFNPAIPNIISIFYCIFNIYNSNW